MLGLGTFLSRTLSRVLKDCKPRPDSSIAIKHRLPCLVRAMRPGRVFGPGKPLFDLPHFQNSYGPGSVPLCFAFSFAGFASLFLRVLRDSW